MGKNGFKKLFIRNFFCFFINQTIHACKCRQGSKLHENEVILGMHKARKKKIQLENGRKWPVLATEVTLKASNA